MSRLFAIAGVAAWVGLVAAAGCGRSSDILGDLPSPSDGKAPLGEIPPPFEACAELSESASLSKVNMLLAVDKSGSMGRDGKWQDTENAFRAFFEDPEAASLRVALRLWPDDDCNEQSCSASACATPQVDLGSLSDPAHRQELIDELADTSPSGRTPMSAALAGAAQWARAHQSDDERAVIVLVTDGEPRGCDQDIDAIAAIAEDALADGIVTYAVGIAGSREEQMNAIASAGGTGEGYFIGAGNTEAELLAALMDIQGKAVACSFAFPDPDDPKNELDPRLVRLEYSPGDGSETVAFPKVGGAAACGDDGGWYYDDPDDPESVTMCPASCEVVQADEAAAVELAVGCRCQVDADCPGDNVCFEGACIDPCTSDAECPLGMCISGRCVLNYGDECTTDDDCEEGLTCTGGQCTDGSPYVGRYEAVQGGAFTCGFTPESGNSRVPWGELFAVGAALALIRGRRGNGPGGRV